MPLGKHDYSLGFASGNTGNGDYVGISDVDKALKNRMHIILKLDYPDYRPTPFDKLRIFSSKKNPRASLPDSGKKQEGNLEELIKLHKKFEERKVPVILPLLGVFFSEGLDYLENTKKHSKRAVDEKWPRVEGIKEDTDESKIFPLSTRAVFGAIALSQALEMIAESKGKKIKSSVPIFLDCLRFSIPYSGILASDFLYNEFDGDAYSAYDALLGKGAITGKDMRLRTQINSRLPNLEEAIVFAETGEIKTDLLDRIAKPNEGKWLPVREALADYAKEKKENPSEEGLMLKSILEKTKQ